MRKAPILYLISAILLIAGWIWYKPEAQNIENKDLAFKLDKLVYTKHARCRMDCRAITDEEVKEIIRNGTINRKKSDPKDKPCPSVAIEGYSTTDRQHIRVVVADCGTELKLITCIDLDYDHPCTCN